MDTTGVLVITVRCRIKVVCGMGLQTPFSYDANEFLSGQVIISVMCAVWSLLFICSGVHSNLFDLV